MIPEADKLFALFQKQGDPETLAQVFDQAAPKLLLLAIHLSGDELGAEDLVQSTFLKIIENAASYDASRPFLPWAGAILSNEARQVWRRSQRAGDPASGGRAVSSDPHEIAAEADTIEILTAAIDDLGDDQRAVVRLKVVHGMKPGEIAQALTISPELARTRLSRGLKSLRAALPASIAGSTLLALNGRGLAQVRAAVVARARAAGGVAPVATGLSSAVWIGVALSLLTGLGAWWLIGDRNPYERDAEVPHSALSAGAETDESVIPVFAPSADVGPVGSGRRRALEPELGEDSPDVSSWLLRGTVRGQNGRPLPGATVQVSVLHGCDVTRLEAARTDDDGRFERDVGVLRALGDLGLLGASLLIEAEAPGHWPHLVELIEAMPAHVSAPGRFEQDFTLLPGRVVRATLRAPGGGPLAFSAMARLVGTDEGAHGWESFESHEDVVLAVRGTGPWRLEVSADEGALFLPLPDLSEGGALGPLTLEEFGVVQGRLVVAGGHPVPHANFSLRRVGDEPRIIGQAVWRDGAPLLANQVNGRTDANGRFRVTALREGTYRLRLDHGAIATTEATLATGALPLDILLEGQALRVRTVDEQGTLIPGLALQFEWSLGDEQHTGRNEINDRGGVFDFLIPFGSHWQFTSGTWQVGFEPVKHFVSPSESSVELTFVVSDSVREGVLELSVFAESGGVRLAYEVDLHHLETDHFPPTVHAQGVSLLSLPAGHYTATVRCPVNASDAGRGFLPTELSFLVDPSQACRRDVRVPPGERVHLELTAGANSVRGSVFYLEEQLAGEWHHAGRFSQRKAGLWRGMDAFVPGASLRSIVVLGPGEHRLRVRTDSSVSSSTTCFIEPGRASLVRVSFD